MGFIPERLIIIMMIYRKHVPYFRIALARVLPSEAAKNNNTSPAALNVSETNKKRELYFIILKGGAQPVLFLVIILENSKSCKIQGGRHTAWGISI